MDRQSRPLTGWVLPQGGPTGAAFRAREFRRSATLCWRGEGFETDNLARTARRDAPRGNAPARLMQIHGEITMLKFTHLPLHVMRGLDPRIHEAVRRRKPYVVGASSWMAGSSPAMTNVGSAQAARLLRFARNDGGYVVVKRQMPSLRGARSATKQSPPPRSVFVAGPWRPMGKARFGETNPKHHFGGMNPRVPMTGSELLRRRPLPTSPRSVSANSSSSGAIRLIMPCWWV